MSSETNPGSGIHRPWQLVILLAAGIFIGSFWLMLALFTLRGQSASLMTYITLLSPGVGILLLVLSAQRSPLPFGAALMVIGVLYFSLAAWRNAFDAGLMLGLPVALVGGMFIFWRKHLQPDWVASTDPTGLDAKPDLITKGKD